MTRSMLFVPAARWPMIQKAAASTADAVCIDLEDSVPVDEKPASRGNAIRAFTELDFGGRRRMLRINGLDTPFAYRDVIEVVEAAGDRMDLIMLPKAGSCEDVAFLDKLLTQIEMHRGFARPIGIEAQIETAAGFVWLREIARSSPRLEALIFGPGDYSASMRMPLSSIGEFDAHDELYPGHRWHAVMHAIVAAARAHGLRCMDGPYAGYRDASGFERSCRIARAMGFDGKQCIHPSQLATVNSLFGPTEEEVRQAEQVVRAYEEAAAAGRGAATWNGRMIDAANLRMARVVLERRQSEPRP
ncbi:MAG TPA: CoA ester lyase [Bryobacteraceae bacterium]|nr:CoA ester lyase [Bryobacteraceae bacterium]